MKNTSILCLVILFLSSIGMVNAKGKASLLAEKSVNVKCFVELVGGKETISLWSIKPSLLKKLTKSIVGQEILVIAKDEQASSNKAIIYKAKQCVLEENEFSSPRARALDEDLPR